MWEGIWGWCIDYINYWKTLCSALLSLEYLLCSVATHLEFFSGFSSCSSSTCGFCVPSCHLSPFIKVTPLQSFSLSFSLFLCMNIFKIPLVSFWYGVRRNRRGCFCYCWYIKWNKFYKIELYFRNLKKTEDRKRKLEELLNSVGQKVSELKEK